MKVRHGSEINVKVIKQQVLAEVHEEFYEHLIGCN